MNPCSQKSLTQNYIFHSCVCNSPVNQQYFLPNKCWVNGSSKCVLWRMNWSSLNVYEVITIPFFLVLEDMKKIGFSSL